ncbi:hypothetical protein GC105_16015 [Alkalibaculum sp. M08DMB]|uniref:DUF6873 domain-containing protein n=1 Tax=Alkalibaculum sporogenes TaxID=2655001 RepID=A0A6A7KE71_9FIRM|nr:hypothetical protein [Alkalibaculum sporogenes]MPW27273.1 hypothetical protein [Alkalibaculum sporogenes]
MKCIVSENISRETYDSLTKYTEDIILIRGLNTLYNAVKSHADIQCFPLDNHTVIVHPEIDCRTLAEFNNYKIKVIFGEKSLKCNYPDNIAYNAVKVGNKIFHNFKYTDTTLYKTLTQNGYELIEVKQGYTKCSVLVVDNNSIITSDRGIAKIAIENKIEVALISPGNIDLPGLNYGFIGGASGTLSEDRLVFFNGDITLHPDGDEIISYLTKKRFDIVSLSKRKLIDVGSFFLIP